jgi:hypothetical protein
MTKRCPCCSSGFALRYSFVMGHHLMWHDADPEDVFRMLGHLASNDPKIWIIPGEEPSEEQFLLEQ